MESALLCATGHTDDYPLLSGGIEAEDKQPGKIALRRRPERDIDVAGLARFEDRGDGAFARWLCRIAENCIRARADYHRAEKRVPPAELQRASQVIDRIAAGTLGPATRG